MEWKDSVTRENLLRAFAGESQARNRYTFAAATARKKGLHLIEAVFLYTADQERAHAKVFYQHLQAGGCDNGLITGAGYPVDLTEDVAELLELAPLSSYLLGLAGVLILNITLPLFFRFGVEKGRLTMFLLIILICGATGALTTVPVSVAEGTLSPAFQNTILAALALLDVVTAAVSVPLSMRLYRARH